MKGFKIAERDVIFIGYVSQEKNEEEGRYQMKIVWKCQN